MNLRVVSATMLLGWIASTPGLVRAGVHASSWPAESVIGAVSKSDFAHQRPWKLDSLRWVEPGDVAKERDDRLAEGTYSLAWAADSAATLLAVALASECLPAGEMYRVVEETPRAGDGGAFRTFDPVIAVYDASQVVPILTPHSDKMMLPAPGAVLSGGLGVVLIGWLRRRRSL